MGCGCGGNSVTTTVSNAGTGTVVGCGGLVDKLFQARNKLITITTITKDDNLKSDYLDARTQIEQLIQNSVTTCPDQATANTLIQYVNSEYAKYS